MRVGEALVDLLKQYGTEVIFGIPGTHSLELYRGLAGSGITHVLPRHEQGAGFMADGYARVSAKPGVCFVITGPGVTNIATPIGQARSDSVPMLVISPVNDLHPDGLNLGRLHEIADQAAVTRPLTVFSETVTSIDAIPRLVADAFDIFYSRRPGPVHIHIPLSILRAEVRKKWQAGLIAEPAKAGTSDIAAVRELLALADMPVIVAGGGCRHFGELVVSLAEKIACPVVTTVAGRGVIAGSHPLSVGAQLAAFQSVEFVAAADLIIVIGSELAEPDHWTDSLELPEKQIWINIDPEFLEYQATGLRICADAKDVVTQLSAACEPADEESVLRSYARCKSVREKHVTQFTGKQKRHWRVLQELRKNLPAGTLVFSDMTQLAYTALDHLPLDRSNSWFHPNGFGTLGYALPAAIGARLADQDSPLLVIVGDAGIQYTLPEMAVAGQLELNLVVLLWQNEGLQQISDDMADAQIEPIGVTQDDPDFVTIAQEFGWSARHLGGLYALADALDWAFGDRAVRQPGPVLLELSEADV